MRGRDAETGRHGKVDDTDAVPRVRGRPDRTPAQPKVMDGQVPQLQHDVERVLRGQRLRLHHLARNGPHQVNGEQVVGRRVRFGAADQHASEKLPQSGAIDHRA